MRSDHVEIGPGVGHPFTVEILDTVVLPAGRLRGSAERLWTWMLADQLDGLTDLQLVLRVVECCELRGPVFIVDEQARSHVAVRRHAGNAGNVDRNLVIPALEIARNVQRLQLDLGCKALMTDRTTDQDQHGGNECRSHGSLPDGIHWFMKQSRIAWAARGRNGMRHHRPGETECRALPECSAFPDMFRCLIVAIRG